jgi:hypothetical protein
MGGIFKNKTGVNNNKMYRVAAIFPEHFQSFTFVLKNIFFINSFASTVSAVCRSINKNNNTHSSKVESTGSYKSLDSRWTSRRTYVDVNINNIKENLTEVWGEEV